MSRHTRARAPARALEPSGEEIVTEGARQLTGTESPVQRSVPKMSEEEHLARLRADVDAVLTLQLSNFADAAWEPLANALVEYGFAVMRAWIATGRIFVELVRSHSFAKLAPPPSGWLDADEAESLAGEVVTVALAAFKNDVLAKGVWKAEKGASLSTFFIGQCKLQFPNIYRKWFEAECRFRRSPAVDPDGSRLHGRAPDDPARLAAQEGQLADILGQMTPRTAEVMIHKFVLGKSYAEIAQEIEGIKDAKAAENLVSRERHKWKTGRRAS